MTLAGAIQRFQRLQVEVPAAVASAHDTAYSQWDIELSTVALEALQAQLELDARGMEAARAWVSTFTSQNAGMVMKFSLQQQERPDPASELPTDVMPVTAEDVAEWVVQGFLTNSQDDSAGKVIDGRDDDVGRTIDRMVSILLTGRETAERQAAREKYLPDIVRFAAGGAASDLIGADGPGIVLAAWVTHIRSQWPRIVREKLEEVIHQ